MKRLAIGNRCDVSRDMCVNGGSESETKKRQNRETACVKM